MRDPNVVWTGWLAAAWLGAALGAGSTGCQHGPPGDDDDVACSDDDACDDDTADDDDTGGACDMDAAVPPWPSFVPAWPGSGRNAGGHVTFQVLDDGPAIADLRVEQLTSTGAVVAWETAGDVDSAVAWDTVPDGCATGYRRTGARREHRMLVAPLEPETTYHVVVRSRDDADADWGRIDLTTPAPEEATELDSCATIGEPGRYRLTADVSAGCTCFDIQADDVELDLGWHTVTYAETDTATQCDGISANGDGGHVHSGIVIQGSAGGDLYSHAVRGYGAEGLTFERLWLYVHTADACGLRTMYSSDVVVRDLVVVSDVSVVTNRHYPGNRGIALDLSPEDAVGSVIDCVLFNVPHWGIYMTADERLDQRPEGQPQTRLMANNHVFASMRATNGYGLGLHANHIEAHHNEIRPLYNGRAVHVTRSNAHVHHNVIEAVERIHGDPDEGYADYTDIEDEASPHDASVCSWVVAHGIRVEGGNFGEIDHNEVYSYSLPDVAFGPTAFNLSCGGAGGSGNDVHDNQFVADRAEGTIGCSGGDVPTLAGWVWGDPPDEPSAIHDNTLRSNGDTLVIEDPSLASAQDNVETGL